MRAEGAPHVFVGPIGSLSFQVESLVDDLVVNVVKDEVFEVTVLVQVQLWIVFVMEEFLLAELDPDLAQALYAGGHVDMSWVIDGVLHFQRSFALILLRLNVWF